MKKIVMFALLVLCSVPALFSGTLSVIKMNNGVVYKGMIKNYDENIYTVEINGRIFTIKEKDVKEVGWENDGNPESEAPKEKKKKEERFTERGYHLYIKPAVSFLSPTAPEVNSVFGSNMLFYGAEAGIDGGTSGVYESVGLLFLMTSASGKLTYNDLLDYENKKTTTQKTTKYILQINAEMSAGLFGDAPFDFYINAGLGGGYSNDEIESYPVYDSWPNLGHYGKLSRGYFLVAAYSTAGIQYRITNAIIASLGAGYRFLSSNSYSGTDWLNDSYYSLDKAPLSLNCGGIVFEGGIKFRY